MNDTQIVDRLMQLFRNWEQDGVPASPKLLGEQAAWIEFMRLQEASEKRVKPIKPQAERDDWWTTRIDPYDDRIRELERFRHRVEDKQPASAWPESAKTFQNFWRCKHHPSAIDNFFDRPELRECEHGCKQAT